MKQTFKILAMMIIILLILTAYNVVNAASISFSVPSSGEKGKSVSISSTVTAAQWNLTIKVNGSTVASSSEVYNIDGNLTKTFSGTYTPTSTGSLTVTLTGDYTDIDGTNTIVNQTKTVTISEPSPTPTPTPEPTKAPVSTPTPTPAKTQAPSSNKSTNNYLESLSVEGGELSPEFNKNTTEYTVNVTKDTTSVKISASKEDGSATVSGTGTIELEEDETISNIKVTSESGSTRTYTIKIVREAKEVLPLGIKTISVTGVTFENGYKKITLTPTFNESTKDYECDLESDIEKLIIELELNDEDMESEIIGADKLKDGENIITILLKRKDSEETLIYQITATRKVIGLEDEQPILSNSQIFLEKYRYVIVVLAVIAAIAGIIFAIVEFKYRKKHNNEDEYEDTNENEEILNEEELKEESRYETAEEEEAKTKRMSAKQGKHY